MNTYINSDLTKSLEKKANRIRKMTARLVYECGGGHIGGALSAVELLTVLYYRYMNITPEEADAPDRDRFILSKGHCLESYLCILQDRGFLTEEELFTFCRDGSSICGHPNRNTPGVEVSTGALGHGLSVAAGMALQLKRSGKKADVYVLLGDGELAEGSVWEAAMFSAHYRLDNLYVLVDRNHLQISGNTEDVIRVEPLEEKWRSFGFCGERVDGNNITEIMHAFSKLQQSPEKPKVLIADTIKGKGISFMENDPKWHHGCLDGDQFLTATGELDEAYERIL